MQNVAKHNRVSQQPQSSIRIEAATKGKAVDFKNKAESTAAEATPETIQRFREPQAIDDATFAFPANVIGKLIPERHELPEDFRRRYDTNPHCVIARQWFYTGISEIYFAEHIDANNAVRHIGACLRSYEPSNDHKIGGVGFLMSLWGATTSRKKPQK